MSAEEHAAIVKEINELAINLTKEVHNVSLQIAIVKQKQEDNHLDNQSDIKLLADKMTKFDSLPCEAHVVDIKNMKLHVAEGKTYRKLLVFFALGLLGSATMAGIAWGSLKMKVDKHQSEFSLIMRQCCDEKTGRTIQ